MKKSKLFTLLAVLLITSLLAVGCSSKSGDSSNKTGTDKTVTFKLGHVLNADPEHPWQKYALKYAEEVNKATEGRVKIDVYPASQLGGDREMIEAIQNDTLDMGLISTMSMGNFVPKLQVWDLPFIWPNDNDKVDVILEDSAIADKIVAAAAEKKINILGFWENDWRGYSSSKALVKTPADIKGQKLRIVETPVLKTFFTECGAMVAPMPWAEIYTGLQQGTVDAQDNGPISTYAGKWMEVQKYFSNTRHMYCPSTISISDKAKAQISEADLKIMTDLAVSIGKEQRDYNRATAKQYMEEFKAMPGVTVYDGLTDEEIASFKEASEATYKVVEKTVGRDLIDEMIALRDQK